MDSKLHSTYVDSEIKRDKRDQDRPLHSNHAFAILESRDPVHEIEDTDNCKNAYNRLAWLVVENGIIMVTY